MASLKHSTIAPAFDGDVVGLFQSRKRNQPDAGYTLIRAIQPNAATLVHGAINDMLRRSAPVLSAKG